MIKDKANVEAMFNAVGERLAAKGASVSIVVVGGTAMNMRGYVDRPTTDVDVLARADTETRRLIHPEPLPPALREAIMEVALDFGQPDDWMNTATAGQWELGLPPGLESRVTWTDFSGLRVGIAAREDLIALKLFAAADQPGPSVHLDDLIALGPTLEDVRNAVDWVRTQDTSAEFHAVLDRVTAHVKARIA